LGETTTQLLEAIRVVKTAPKMTPTIKSVTITLF